jgi:hypothetical protein
MKLFEAIGEAGAKDGGFVFQTILSYRMTWQIVDGETKFDQKDVNARLHQVDAFPDLKFMSGWATLNYAVLSEVTLLKRKIDLATEYIKRAISAEYAKELDGEPTNQGGDRLVPEPIDKTQLELPPGEERLGLPEPQKQLLAGQKMLEPGQKQLNPGQRMLDAGVQENAGQLPAYTASQLKEINNKYFSGTTIDVVFEANNIVLREVSSSSLDSGNPGVTLKLSTGMVDTLDGKSINSWDNFKVTATGRKYSGTIDNSSTPPISRALIYDTVDNTNDLIFRTILPSVLLEFKGDSVKIDTYSNRSNQVAVRSTIDFENLFNYDEAKKTPVVEPEEGENLFDGGEVSK